VALFDRNIHTDYIDFHFYVDSEFTTVIRIDEIRNGKLFHLTVEAMRL
jgi:hypothetical protein